MADTYAEDLRFARELADAADDIALGLSHLLYADLRRHGDCVGCVGSVTVRG
ncbi:hypothetical protein [Actinoplanes sp. NBRC 103695]|uniref:hypothetical protein n=1 Tax=Actinoplanes sp. NBRC 103695 TaxID=3032202 RepID=UPI0024A3AF19|nr:hypothetical protein [Actinoplanes sp. NBRC 103695]GLY96802.1 hypothetical protein Acsp02_40560 [Actinoplanes sp. NBRC 103695]